MSSVSMAVPYLVTEGRSNSTGVDCASRRGTTLERDRTPPKWARDTAMVQPPRTHVPLSTRRLVRPVARQFYEDVLRTLIKAKVPFLVGGALALKHFAGIVRGTKDLDIFLRK